MKKEEKKDRRNIFVILTNREYKGVAGYNVEGIAFDKETARKIFKEWKKDRIKEFSDEIKDAEENGIELTNKTEFFLYNDNNRYYIEGKITDCPCTIEVKKDKPAFVSVVAGLSDGNDIEDCKVFASEQAAINWMKNQILDIKEEWESKLGKYISWHLDEKRECVDLESDEVSVSVFGFIKKIETL